MMWVLLLAIALNALAIIKLRTDWLDTEDD